MEIANIKASRNFAFFHKIVKNTVLWNENLFVPTFSRGYFSLVELCHFTVFALYAVKECRERNRFFKDVDEWLIDYTERLKAAIEEGRRLASSGRMELDVHDALDSLDKVVDLANQVKLLFV